MKLSISLGQNQFMLNRFWLNIRSNFFEPDNIDQCEIWVMEHLTFGKLNSKIKLSIPGR